jgi:hypothetical protein
MTLPADLAELLAAHPELAARADSLIAERAKPQTDALQQFIDLTPEQRGKWVLDWLRRDRGGGVLTGTDTSPPVELVVNEDWTVSEWSWK